MKVGPNGKPMPAACLKRKHLYDADKVCKRCGWKRTGIIGRPKRVAGVEGSARLAATLGVPAPAPTGNIFSETPTGAPSSPVPVVPDQVTPPKPDDKAAALAETATAAAADKKEPEKKEPSKASKQLCRRISRKLTRLFDVATDSMIEAFEGKDYTREPGEADDEDLEDFEENLAEVLAQKIPDVEMGPGVACILAGALIVGDKCLGSKKIPKKPAITAAPRSETPEGTPTTKAPPDPEDSAAPDAATTLSLIPLPR